MLIEIVTFKDNIFARDLIDRKDFEPSKIIAPDVIAYRFINDPNEHTDIYSWNLCSELASLLEPLPAHTTPEVLFLYKNSFLNKFVDAFHKICNETNLSEVAVSNAMLNYSTFHGNLSLLSSENIDELICLLRKSSIE